MKPITIPTKFVGLDPEKKTNIRNMVMQQYVLNPNDVALESCKTVRKANISQIISIEKIEEIDALLNNEEKES